MVRKSLESARTLEQVRGTAFGAERKPLRALWITGGCCHNYPLQAHELTNAVAQLTPVEWTVVNEGGNGTKAEIPLYSDANWAKGFDVVVRGYPGALFVSAGGYHHHIGLNTWHSAGSAPPTPGSIGLRSFEVLLPDRVALQHTLERVRGAGIAAAATDRGMLVRDPSGNGVLLTVA